MTMETGERQVATELSGIRADHVARYAYVACDLPPRSRVIDFASGIGYGAKLLADASHNVSGYDISGEAIAYGLEHYAHPRVTLYCGDAMSPPPMALVDAAVCFETIEHVEDPRVLLKALREAAPVLYSSVPNETVFPWNNHAFHHRHYTPAEFESLLAECGWKVDEWLGQAGSESDVEPGLKDGRTVIAKASRAEVAVKLPYEPDKNGDVIGPPRHVALVALGPSAGSYLEITKRLGGRHKYCDETWAINAVGDVFACDRVFHMDDVRVQEVRAAAAPDGNIAAMLSWLKTDPGPVITSRAHPDYPGLVEFPLEDVVRKFNHAYFNSTAAYAIAYAIHIGVKKISLFGFDFTYENAHHAEKGRACVEFWLGIASAAGIAVIIPRASSLMDACNTQAERMYGYDTVDVTVARQADGQIRVSMTERDAPLPTAAEMEERYDHNAHPNPLVGKE